MSFDDLPEVEKAQLLSFMSVFRSTFTQAAQTMNRLHQLDRIWTAQISAIVSSLDDGSMVPDSPPSAGAGNLIREEIQGLMAAAQAVLSSNDDNESRANYIKVAGVVGVVG